MAIERTICARHSCRRHLRCVCVCVCALPFRWLSSSFRWIVWTDLRVHGRDNGTRISPQSQVNVKWNGINVIPFGFRWVRQWMVSRARVASRTLTLRIGLRFFAAFFHGLVHIFVVYRILSQQVSAQSRHKRMRSLGRAVRSVMWLICIWLPVGLPLHRRLGCNWNFSSATTIRLDTRRTNGSVLRLRSGPSIRRECFLNPNTFDLFCWIERMCGLCARRRFTVCFVLRVLAVVVVYPPALSLSLVCLRHDLSPSKSMRKSFTVHTQTINHVRNLSASQPKNFRSSKLAHKRTMPLHTQPIWF